MNNLPIKVLENSKNNLQVIKLTEEPYAGIMYTYGQISFDEDLENDRAVIKFEYNIHDTADIIMDDSELKEFEQYIGRILEELIHQGIANNDLTYTGGVDENRTKDSEQSDT